ncbi:MAG: hypothetical protein ACI8PZ_005142 [Myxococcota bacterium]|jgi:hypothetical protein
MQTACTLAGFVGAQALWGVSEGGALVPLLAFESAEGQRSMDRFPGEDVAAAIDAALEGQVANAGGQPVSVVAHQARLPLADGPVDAMVLYVVDRVARRRVVLGVPFALEPELAVLTLQVLHVDNVEERELEALVDAFFTGVEGHPYGTRLWAEHFRDIS